MHIEFDINKLQLGVIENNPHCETTKSKSPKQSFYLNSNDTPTTAENTVRSTLPDQKFSFQTLQLYPIPNKLDNLRRKLLGWCSDEYLTSNLYFDALDVLDVFESLLELNQFFKTNQIINHQQQAIYEELINSYLSYILGLKHGEAILKFANIKKDSTIEVKFFADLEAIFREIPEFIALASLIPTILPTTLLLKNKIIDNSVISCKAGVYRVLNAVSCANPTVRENLFKMNPLFENVEDFSALIRNQELIIIKKDYALISPFFLMKHYSKSIIANDLSSEVTILHKDKITTGLIVYNRNIY